MAALTRRTTASLACGWAGVALAVVAGMVAIGDGLGHVVAYLLVWLVTTTLPGVLVWRALSRPTTVVQEVGFGSVLGIGLLLLAWVPATLVDVPLLMWLWPAGVAAVFAAVPSLRRHWLPQRPENRRTGPWWQVAMMGVCLLSFGYLWSGHLREQPLPPHASTIFQDVWYELSLLQHLTRSVLISDPAVAGVPLNYHWFSNAHAAATQLLSGAPPYEVVLHLWPVPMVLTFAFATAAAAERLMEGASGQEGVVRSTRWWVGPLAALLVVALPVALFLSNPVLRGIDNGFVVSSTSGDLALVIVLCLVGPVLDLLDGRGGKGTWLLLVLLLCLSAGTKPSILPVVACGSALVLVVQWWRSRRFPRTAALLTVLPLALIPLAALVVTGSTGGSRVQLFATLALDDDFMAAAGSAVGLPGHGGWLAPGLADGPPEVWRVAAVLFVLYVLTELPRLVGLAGVAYRRLRPDLGLWWCSGVVASGFCGLWLLAHPGHSQHYFWRIVIGLGMVVTVTSAVRLLPYGESAAGARSQLRVTGVVGVVTGLAILPTELRPAGSVLGRLAPYGAAAVVLAVVLAVLRGLPARRRLLATPAPVLTVVTCFCVALALPVTVGGLGKDLGPALVGLPAPTGPAQRYVTADEQRGALWLAEHSDPEDVVSTNVFCAPVPYEPDCRHVAFWVAALTGRQLLLGAWAYTAQNLTNYASGDVSYQQEPSPWPALVHLSLRAVRSPSAQVVEALRAHGVRWVFADRRATFVSPSLGRYATLRYANSQVLVYELAD